MLMPDQPVQVLTVLQCGAWQGNHWSATAVLLNLYGGLHGVQMAGHWSATAVLLNLHGGLHGVQMDYSTPESA